MKRIFLTTIATLQILISNNLTIYTDDLANINKIVDINLSKGLNRVIYKDLPSRIINDSIYAKFNKTIRIISQSYIREKNFEDLLLKCNLDKNISFYKRKDNISKGKLINVSPIVVQSKSKYYLIKDTKRLIYTNYPKNSKAFVEWQIDSNDSFVGKYNLNFFFKGLSWISNYRVALKKKNLVLEAYATINNSTNMDINASYITLIAGNTNSMASNSRPIIRKAIAPVNALASSDKVINKIIPKKIENYYKYALPDMVDIKSQEVKEIPIIDKKSINYKRYAQALTNSFSSYKKDKLKFIETIEFNNKLNVPLPKGKVRIYKDNNFLGESWINNSPNNQKITLKIGEMFDVYGEKIVTKSVSKNKYRSVETKYILHNNSTRKVELRVEEQAPTYGEKINYSTSCKGICKAVKESAFLNSYRVMLDANSSYNFTTTVEVFN